MTVGAENMAMTHLRYSPDIERPDPDEAATVDSIMQGMT